MKRLGRWYNASLNDTEQVDQIRKDVVSGLEKINRTALPCKLKLWCMQFGLIPCLMWPLTLYEAPLSKLEKVERLISSYARKWFGLPRLLSSIGLYGKGVLELPISGLSEEYKCAKVRLEMTLMDSRDPFVAQAAPRLTTGRNWTPSVASKQAMAALKHRDIVDRVQKERSSLGPGARTPVWNKASLFLRHMLVVDELRKNVFLQHLRMIN